MKSLRTAAAAIIGGATMVSAQLATSCQGAVCYAVHVPQSAAASGKGDIFFQITAPSTYTWAGLGQGTQMAGANIFVVYSDASNSNVTLSPRLGTGEVQPLHDTDAQVELLAGSGISDGMMTANVRCSNCGMWSGGSMSFNDPSSNWIWAWKQGAPVASDSASATIEQHDDHGTVNFDLTKAAGGSDSTNPFVGAAAANTTSSSDDSSSSSAGQASQNIISAHAVLMTLAFGLFFPAGAALRRLIPSTSIWLHAGFQMFSYALAIAGMGIGISIALTEELLMDYHPIIGLVAVCFLGLQPISGLLQHSHYNKRGARGIFGWAHKVLGIPLILLGMINGGFGLSLSGTTGGPLIAYSVLVAIIGVSWLSVMAFTSGRKRMGGKKRSNKALNEGSVAAEENGGAAR